MDHRFGGSLKGVVVPSKAKARRFEQFLLERTL
jgi:hypothetical protein